MEKLLLIGFEFAGHVINNYWQIKPYLKQIRDKQVIEKFAGAFMIGMQMRFEYLNADDVDRFVVCALGIEAKRQKKIGYRPVRWFISTDQDSQIRSLVQNYSQKTIIGEGKIGHVNEMPDTYERALIDIELLSLCDELIITGGSTFGFMASIKSQKMPYYVEGKRSMPECKVFEFFAPTRIPKGDAIF